MIRKIGIFLIVFGLCCLSFAIGRWSRFSVPFLRPRIAAREEIVKRPLMKMRQRQMMRNQQPIRLQKRVAPPRVQPSVTPEVTTQP